MPLSVHLVTAYTFSDYHSPAAKDEYYCDLVRLLRSVGVMDAVVIDHFNVQMSYMAKTERHTADPFAVQPTKTCSH